MKQEKILAKIWDLHNQIRKRSVRVSEDNHGTIYQTDNGYFTIIVQEYCLVGKTDSQGNLVWQALAQACDEVSYIQGISSEKFLDLTLETINTTPVERMIESKFLLLELGLRKPHFAIPAEDSLYTNSHLYLKITKSGDKILGGVGSDWKATKNASGVLLDGICPSSFMIL